MEDGAEGLVVVPLGGELGGIALGVAFDEVLQRGQVAGHPGVSVLVSISAVGRAYEISSRPRSGLRDELSIFCSGIFAWAWFSRSSQFPFSRPQ